MSGPAGEETYRDAIRGALAQALRDDPRVFLMGEDLGAYGGSYAVTLGLLEEFGPERVRDTPLSELSVVGAGVGAALAGARPVVEVMTVNFSLLALDQIVNTAATLRYMSGGQLGVPMVIRMPTGGGRQVAAQHSRSLEPWYASVPGLVVAAPATVEDAREMTLAAVAAPDPVVLFENVRLYPASVRRPAGADPEPLSGSLVMREGADLTIATYGGCVPICLEAAEGLAAAGIEATVVDLRVLRPLDAEVVLASAAETGRVVIVEEAHRSLGVGAEVAARIAERMPMRLAAPVARVAGAEVPMPYARHMEELALPSPERVVEAAGRVCGRRVATDGRPERAVTSTTHCTLNMPDLDPEVHRSRLLQYVIAAGDRIHRGDPFAWIETNKGAIEIEAYTGGVVEELLVPPGTVAHAGTPLVRLCGGSPGGGGGPVRRDEAPAP